jgi:hypothetical protein
MKPSVTELIKLLDKPALLKWANKIGLEGIKLEDYSKKVMQQGTSIHKQIELYIKYKIPFENKFHQESFDMYFKDKEILSYESIIETEWFKGRLDLKILFKGKTYVCDFKLNQKFVYFENKLQLAAYRFAENADGVGIISIPDFTFLPVIIKDFTPYEEILKSLSNIYTLKKQL